MDDDSNIKVLLSKLSIEQLVEIKVLIDKLNARGFSEEKK